MYIKKEHGQLVNLIYRKLSSDFRLSLALQFPVSVQSFGFRSSSSESCSFFPRAQFIEHKLSFFGLPADKMVFSG